MNFHILKSNITTDKKKTCEYHPTKVGQIKWSQNRGRCMAIEKVSYPKNDYKLD